MKLFIVMVGLFAIVAPRSSTGPTEILFLETADETLPAHELRLTFPGPAQSRPTHPRLLTVTVPRGLDLGVAGMATANEVVRMDESRARFTHLDEILGAEATVSPKCSGDSALQDCKGPGSKPLLGGRVALSGGTLRPAEVQGAEITLDAESLKEALRVWEFRPLNTDAGSWPRSRPLNGALFEATLPGKALHLELGSTTLEIGASEYFLCSELAGKTGGKPAPCVFLQLTNSVAPADFKAEDPIDEEFGLAYDLLTSEPGSRPVPHVVIGTMEDPPESRCIPPLMFRD